jgi:uncharacterized protein with NRDE domain
MCTLALYFKVFPAYPLVVAANRDEHYARPSAPPAIVGTSPTILAGRDLRAGGTWLGVNEYGLLVGILNRRLSTGPAAQAEHRSRGLLCLDLLRLSDATAVHELVPTLRATPYQPFTVVCADKNSACLAYNTDETIEIVKLESGLHVFSNSYEASAPSEKVSRLYERFSMLCQPTTAPINVSEFVGSAASVLGDHSLGDGSKEPREATCVHSQVSGTVSSSIIFFSDAERQFQTYYCAGAPCRNSFKQYPRLDVR